MLVMTEIREMRQLRDENVRLKRLVAELTLGKHILGKSSGKSSEASALSRAGKTDPRAICSERPQGDRAGAVLAWWLLCQEPGPRLVGTSVTHSGDRTCQAALWLPAHPSDAAPGGLGGKPQARVSLVSARRPTDPHAGVAPQAHVPASRARLSGNAHPRALEHGLCPRSVVPGASLSGTCYSRSV
jgi:hypothetical protein